MHTQPVGDIDSVIGRFQAWAGSRNAAEVKPGIRELTYEEALESRRNRWRGTMPDAAKDMPANELRAEPGVTHVEAPGQASARAAARMKHGGSKNRGAKRKASGKTPERSRALKPSRTAKTMTPSEKKAAASPRSQAKTAPPAFREVLAQTIQPTDAIVAAQPSEAARQVAISIRLAPAERALLRTRAAESGITVSAYMRQCALEVEQLRAEVKQTLAALQQQAATPAAAPEPSPTQKPGPFTRLMRRLLPASSPRLALRA